jgi:hypothetical protein
VSALPFVRCAGAPRDLGLDQGRSAQDAIRAALRDGRRDRSAPRAARDLERFFPHHAERMQGLSLGAGVPARALAARLAEWLAGDGGLAAVLSTARAGGALLGRSIHAAADALVLRASAPDNDYRTLELAPAWSAAAWIGVNEHGLAATATALPAAAAQLGGCAAPAQLLVQDVLQRFDSVDKAVDWALRRPAGGTASLLLADASGSTAAVAIEGRERRLIGTGEGTLVGLGPLAARAALEKALAESARLDADALARLLDAAAAHAPLVAVADPLGRRLGVSRGGAALEWHGVEPR